RTTRAALSAQPAALSTQPLPIPSRRMPQAQSLADSVHELQHLDRTSLASQGAMILDAFAKHTRFDSGALYLRDLRGSELRLAAKSLQIVAPEILDFEGRAEEAVKPAPTLVVPLQSSRESIG